jgi:gamma-glutamylcyclotransferase (GGCT)/AIG2-like uncharacterized protein YtfP
MSDIKQIVHTALNNAMANGYRGVRSDPVAGVAVDLLSNDSDLEDIQSSVLIEHIESWRAAQGSPARLRLFVYGTLRKGQYRDICEIIPGTTFVDFATINGQLHDLHDFPGLELNDKGVVQGEVYDMPDNGVPMLDRIEGYRADTDSGFYLRRKVIATLKGGSTQECIVYEVSKDYHSKPVIKSGDWIKHIKRKRR